MNVELDPRSHDVLFGVDARLARVVRQAHPRFQDRTGLLFRVTSGRRTLGEQTALFKAGKTGIVATSRHLSGQAVDLAILTADRGTALWDVSLYGELNSVIQQVALCVPLPVIWGGSWKQVDATHWEIHV